MVSHDMFQHQLINRQFSIVWKIQLTVVPTSAEEKQLSGIRRPNLTGGTYQDGTLVY